MQLTSTDGHGLGSCCQAHRHAGHCGLAQQLKDAQQQEDAQQSTNALLQTSCLNATLLQEFLQDVLDAVLLKADWSSLRLSFVVSMHQSWTGGEVLCGQVYLRLRLLDGQPYYSDRYGLICRRDLETERTDVKLRSCPNRHKYCLS